MSRIGQYIHLNFPKFTVILIKTKDGVKVQINRLFEIIYILLEKQIITAKELAERFEVSVRTIYRDVEMLSQSKIPIYMRKGRGGGISLLPDFVLNKAILTEQEKQNILFSMKAVSALNPMQADTALSKLNSMLGDQNTDWIEVDLSSWGNAENESEYFEILKNAILQKKAVTFTYASGRGETLGRKVYPLKLLFKGAAWYLYSYCTMRKDFRSFKIRRIAKLSVIGESFQMTAPAKIFDKPTNNINNIEAIFRISPQMAFRVYDEICSYDIDENGDYICKLCLPDINTVCTYATSFGEYCKIISPSQAVEQMKDQLKKTLDNYL